MHKRILAIIAVAVVMISTLSIYASAFTLPYDANGGSLVEYYLLGGNNSLNKWGISDHTNTVTNIYPESYSKYSIYSVNVDITDGMYLGDLILDYEYMNQEQRNKLGIYGYYFFANGIRDMGNMSYEYILNDGTKLIASQREDIMQRILYLEYSSNSIDDNSILLGQRPIMIQFEASEDVILVINKEGDLTYVVTGLDWNTGREYVVRCEEVNNFKILNLLTPNIISKYYFDKLYQEAFEDGYNSVPLSDIYQAAYKNGYDTAKIEMEERIEYFYDLGITEGYDIGHEEGYTQGLSEGYSIGFQTALKDTTYESAFNEGSQYGWDIGHKVGLNDGYKKGYTECEEYYKTQYIYNSDDLENYYNIGYLAGQDTNQIVENGISGFFNSVTGFFDPVFSIGIGNITVLSLVGIAIIVCSALLIIKVVKGLG